MSTSKRDRFTEIAGPVSRETFERMEAFEAAFLQWARRINLAAPSTLHSVWERHILDSAQLFKLAPDESLRWVDLGSGGGFPGAVLAILLSNRPGAEIHLVESNGKKAAFLQTVLKPLNTPAIVHRARIEAAIGMTGPADIVTARALAPLHQLLALARPWLAQGAHGLFHKGRDYAAEIEENRDLGEFDLIIHEDKIDPQGRILEIAASGAVKCAPSKRRAD